MRIGNQTIVRNYTNSLNTNLARLNAYSERITTQRRFASMYENSALGVKTMQLRRSAEFNASYTATAKTVKSTLTSSETEMQKISDLGKAIAEKYDNALNSTNSEQELGIIANEIRQLRDQILTCANGQFAGDYLFGGTNTKETPFTTGIRYDQYGKEINVLYYNGIDVSQMLDSKGEIRAEYRYLLDDAAFVDLGLGMKNNADGSLNQTTAFKSTMVGLEFMGMGDKNIYLLCTEMIDALEGKAYRYNDDGSVMLDADGNAVYAEFSNIDRFSDLLNEMHAAYNNVSLRQTELGADYQYLEYTVERLADELLNIADRQNDVEWIDPSEAIMQFKMQEYVYNAALQMGQRVLQPTLFNFIS